MIKCSGCDMKNFYNGNGGLNRYYCNHPQAPAGAASLICKTERRSELLTIKTAPKWCPLNEKRCEEEYINMGGSPGGGMSWHSKMNMIVKTKK